MITISVVMPTYNTDISYLKEAVDSILNQTFQDFEFIIIDDGSTNNSVEYLKSLSDSRIRIIRNEKNIGITKSLNIGFREAKGKYIARMDADDVSLPERFEKQFVFMENHPDVIVCGAKSIDLGKEKTVVSTKIEDMESYRVRLLFINPGPRHPTAFFNHEKLLQYHILYDEQLKYAQDYGMWVTISQHGRICILPDVLLCYRTHPKQITKAHREQQVECHKVTQRKLLTQLLGEVTEEENNFHYSFSNIYITEEKMTPEANEWYSKLLTANKQQKIYDQRKLRKYIIKIKKVLIWQTFRKDMSKTEKAMLFFHYLPFFSAVKATFDIIFLKIRIKAKKLI